MKSKIFSIAIGFVCLSLVSGCIFSKNRIIKSEEGFFTFTEERSNSEKSQEDKIDKKEGDFIGFSGLVDMRPQQDISYMTSIKEKVSEEVLRELRASGVFPSIHYPIQQQDQIEIRGCIYKFTGVSADTMISYIPVMNVFTIFGLPSQRVTGEVDISLEVKDRKTNKVIKSFRHKFKSQKKYNIYSFSQEREKEELANSFMKVVQELIEDIQSCKDEILKKIDVSYQQEVSSSNVKQPKEQETVVTSVTVDAKQPLPDNSSKAGVDNAGK